MAATTPSPDRCPHCGALDIVTRGGRLECLQCRQVMLLAELGSCPRCGEAMPSAAATCARCASSPSPTGPEAGARGVGGWLLVLAVSLAAVGPVALLVGLVRLAGELERAALVPGLQAFAWTEAGIDAVLTGALAVGGVKLLTLRPDAVRFCRRALALAPLASLAVLGAGWLLLAPQAFERVLPAAAFGSARTAVLALGWLAYLHSSRRVRDTFPD
jgi:hypothetical protein